MVSGVNQSKEDISDCKSLRDVAISTKFWPQIGTNLTKMAITSVMCHLSVQSLV